MSGIKVVFVGTGDASSSGARSHQAIWVESPQICLLLDCGPTTMFRLQQLAMDPDKLDAVLFTHFHGDHIGGIVQIDLTITIGQQRKHPIVYGGPVGLARRLPELCKAFYSGFYPNDQFARVIVEYDAGKNYEICDNATVETVAMQHSEESLGYRLCIGERVIAFTGDTQWHEGIATLAHDADLLICECFHYHRSQPNFGHCSYEELSDNLPSIGARRIILTHPGPEMVAAQNLELELAYEGMEIVL